MSIRSSTPTCSQELPEWQLEPETLPIKQGSKGRPPLGGVWGVPTFSLFPGEGRGRGRLLNNPANRYKNLTEFVPPVMLDTQADIHCHMLTHVKRLAAYVYNTQEDEKFFRSMLT